MPSKQSVIHTDHELQIGSEYVRYHIRMYIETLLWLNDHPSLFEWDTVRNAVLEDHLVHARILINFLEERKPRDRRKIEDVLAEDYFHDKPGVFEPMDDAFLHSQAYDIGGQAVHITKKAMPKLRSQKEWPIRDIAARLAPAIKPFLDSVPPTRFADGVRQDCLVFLAKLVPPKIPTWMHPDT